jgi:hypothetical protein
LKRLLIGAGFSFWVPGEIHSAEINKKGTGSWIEIKHLTWGVQTGLPLCPGQDGSASASSFATGSSIVVKLPEEDSSVWFDKWGPPSFWTATTNKAFNDLQKQHQADWRSCPTPAVFAEELRDDSGRVGKHFSDLEHEFLKDYERRLNTRKNVLNLMASGKVFNLADIINKHDAPSEEPEEEIHFLSSSAGEVDLDTCSFDQIKCCIFNDGQVCLTVY